MTLMTNDHSLVCSYKIGRGVLEGVQEIIGKAGVNAIFNLAHLSHLLPTNGIKKFDYNFSFADLSAIQQALEELYGPRGGRGVALRSGRVFFKYFLRALGDHMSMTTLDFRLLPTHQRVKAGLTSMAATYRTCAACKSVCGKMQRPGTGSRINARGAGSAKWMSACAISM
jgi:hypothetical protein